jgi:surfeit locus 1 family protein
LSKALAVILLAFFFVLFAALGTWQVQRRAWKLDLIARVEQRVHAPAVPAPGPTEWPQVTAATDEYRHVTASGTFLDAAQTLVQAVTDLGAGYWVLTPLQRGDGSIVLVNRGFVAADDRNRVQPAGRPEAGLANGSLPVPPSTITGLLRITEPKGAFLRHNDPTANQWYSRDIQAIAAARGLTHVAPYFIDAEAPPGMRDTSAPLGEPAASGPTPSSSSASLAPAAEPPAVVTNAPSPGATAAGTNAPPPDAKVAPTPGLTVIHFHNSHLVYAITWYTLALMTAIAIPLGMRKQ